jgi:hypothetical protein
LKYSAVLEPRVAEAISSDHPHAVEIGKFWAAAKLLAKQNNDHLKALKYLGKIQNLLRDGEGKGAAAEDPADKEAWKKAKHEVRPLAVAAVKAGHPRAEHLQKIWQAAVMKAGEQAYAEATKIVRSLQAKLVQWQEAEQEESDPVVPVSGKSDLTQRIEALDKEHKEASRKLGKDFAKISVPQDMFTIYGALPEKERQEKVKVLRQHLDGVKLRADTANELVREANKDLAADKDIATNAGLITKAEAMQLKGVAVAFFEKGYGTKDHGTALKYGHEFSQFCKKLQAATECDPWIRLLDLAVKEVGHFAYSLSVEEESSRSNA